MEVSQAHKMKGMERDNASLHRAVSNLTLDTMILNEALTGKYQDLQNALGPVSRVSCDKLAIAVVFFTVKDRSTKKWKITCSDIMNDFALNKSRTIKAVLHKFRSPAA